MDAEMMEEMEEDMMDKMDWDMKPSEMWMKAEELMRFTSINPFMGTITYLMVAIGMTTHKALDLFRYRQPDSDSKKDAYAAFRIGADSDWNMTTGEFEGTNWFKSGALIANYTNLAVWGIAAITQIMAGLGIAPEINMLVWFFGVMLLNGLANSIYALFAFIAYETGYANREEPNAGETNTDALYLIRSAMTEFAAVEASAALALYMQMENWHWAAWEALTQEAKETNLEELMAEIEEWDAEKMAEMEAEMKEEKKGKNSEDADEGAEDVEEDADEDAEEVAEEEE